MSNKETTLLLNMDESSPGRILLRLEELRRWQRTQEELIRQKEKLLLSTIDSEEEDSRLYATENGSAFNISKESAPYLPSTTASEDDCSIKQRWNPPKPIKHFNSEVKPRIKLDEMPILPPAKDFETLLEDKIKKNDACISVKSAAKVSHEEKPKVVKPRTFLKRGQGLVRYNMTPQDIHLRPNQRKLKTNAPKASKPGPCIKNKLPELSAKEQLSVPKNKLPELSAIEEPLSVPESNENVILNENIVRCVSAFNNTDKNKKTWAALLSEEQDLYLGLIDSEKHNLSDSCGSSYLERLKSSKETAEQNMFDLLERKVNNSSFCSSSSFISRVVGARGVDTPTVNRDYVNTFPHVLNLKPSLTESETIENLNSSRESVEESGRDTKLSSEGDSTGNDEYSESTDTEPTCKIYLTKTPVSTSTPNRGINNKDKMEPDTSSEKVLKIKIRKDARKTENSSTEETTIIQDESDDNSKIVYERDLAPKAELLKARLQELQTEIDIFKTENESLSRLKSDLQMEREQFLNEKAAVERKLNEDRIVSEYHIAEEQEKLAKQKQLYDRHIKDMKGNVVKKERDEITNLKRELLELKEQIKGKDAKNGAASSRYRNRIKFLEENLADLKIETDKLKKENTRLRGSNERFRRIQSFKSLAEINQSLAQFTVNNNMTGGSEESNNSNKRVTNTKVNKNVVVKKPLISRSKSVPNLTTTSHYAKYFSQRDNNHLEESSEEETDSDHSISFYCPNTSSRRQSIISQELPEVGLCRDRQTSPIQFDNVTKSAASSIKKSRTSINGDDIIERMYTKRFEEGKNSTSVFGNDVPVQVKAPLDHTLIERQDGSKEIRFTNGNTKIVSADETYSKFVYYNGDIKETFYDEGMIKYYYKEADTYHTTYKDGSQLLQFPDGTQERRYPDGAVESRREDGARRWESGKGGEEWRFPDGTVLVEGAQGERTLRFPNGQIEVHTRDHKRREFPDGTVKVVYADGAVETRYASGRVRVKDSTGRLLMDSAGNK